MFAPLQLFLLLLFSALASNAHPSHHRPAMGLGSKLKGLGDRVQAELGVGASSGGVPHGGYQQQAWQPPPQQQGAAWQSPQQQVQQAFAPYNPIRHGKVHGG
jgi:hypothetical protein